MESGDETLNGTKYLGDTAGERAGATARGVRRSEAFTSQGGES